MNRRDPLAVPTSAHPRAERSIQFQPTAPPSSAALPLLSDALTGAPLPSPHVQWWDGTINSRGDKLPRVDPSGEPRP